MEEMLRKNWEKSYWKFRVVQFQRRLHDNSTEALALPKSFVENVTEKMADNITLKTASGAVWGIGLVTGKDGNVFLKHGWKQFVKSHCLKKNDTLYFKYCYGDSKLEVTMFDGDTSIEKACSHFVENPIHDPVTENTQSDVKYSAMKHRGEYNRRTCDDDDDIDDVDDVVDDGDDDDLHLARKKSANRTKRQRDDDSDHLNDSPPRKNRTTRGCMTKEKVWKSMYQGYHDSPQPNQRTAPNLARNQEENVDDVLEVRMFPTYVAPSYNFSFSKKWALEQGINKSQQALLVNEDGKTRKVILYIRGNVVGVNLKGWRGFATNNRLKIRDRCYFSVVPGSRDPIALSVRIVRAKDDDERDP